MKKFILNAVLIALLALMAGCGPELIPLAVKGAVIDEKSASISVTKDGVTVRAALAYLDRTPYNLETYFIPFTVEVRNETGKDISVGFADFILLDDKRNQYRAFPPEKISEIVKSDPEYAVKPQDTTFIMPTLANYTSPMDPPPYRSGSSLGTPYYDAGLGHWVYPSGGYDRYRRDEPGETLMQDIFLDSLPVGTILDGAQVSGNLYFKFDYRDVKNVKIRASINGTIIELPFVVQ
ncbi:MAG: hypothetical protein RQ824_09355 [bacterium]|nr:hypothetical protein [bacterium]